MLLKITHSFFFSIKLLFNFLLVYFVLDSFASNKISHGDIKGLDEMHKPSRNNMLQMQMLLFQKFGRFSLIKSSI